MLAPRLDINALGASRKPGHPRIVGPVGNPTFEPVDQQGRQLAIGRHFKILVADGANQQTLVWFAWHHRRTRVATGDPTAFGVEYQATFRFAGSMAVALVAVLFENRQDLLVEGVLGRPFSL